MTGAGCWKVGVADPHRVDLGQVEQRSEVREVVFGPEVAGESLGCVGDDIRGRENARTPDLG